jgi:hypothetical protein
MWMLLGAVLNKIKSLGWFQLVMNATSELQKVLEDVLRRKEESPHHQPQCCVAAYWKLNTHPSETSGAVTTKICNFTQRKTTVWVKQNVHFFQQNGSVIKIEQN